MLTLIYHHKAYLNDKRRSTKTKKKMLNLPNINSINANKISI